MSRADKQEESKPKASKKRCIVIGVLTPIIAFALAFLILIFVTMGMYSPLYLSRVMTHFDSSVKDYKIFPERVISKSDKPYLYQKNYDASLAELSVTYFDGKRNRTVILSDFVNRSDTLSFIVVKDGVVIYEQYANDYDESSVNTSFSMAKSVVSLLIGKAIEDGYISSVNQRISEFIGEFSGLKIGDTTIEQLLLMRSDIVYEEDKLLWFGDDSLTYWHPDLRKLALSHTDMTGRYGGKFHYNNYHPLLLGIILERSTGMSVSEYFERSFWHKIGAEYDASWSLDSKESGFEKLESGINFRAMDFIKIGSTVLNGGCLNGERIIGEDWLKASMLCTFPLNSSEYDGTFLQGRNIGYKYMWYTIPSASSGDIHGSADGTGCANTAFEEGGMNDINDSESGIFDIFAWGKSDQILYISPSNSTVILRTGISDGGVKNWAEFLRDLSGLI